MYGLFGDTATININGYCKFDIVSISDSSMIKDLLSVWQFGCRNKLDRQIIMLKIEFREISNFQTEYASFDICQIHLSVCASLQTGIQ